MDTQATELRRIRRDMLKVAADMADATEPDTQMLARWRGRCRALRRHQRDVLRTLPQKEEEHKEDNNDDKNGSMLALQIDAED